MQKPTLDIPKQHRLEGCYHLDKSFFTAPRAFDPVVLYQIGRLYCKSQTVIGEHAHFNCFELTVATGGKGIVYTNGVAVPISRGEIPRYRYRRLSALKGRHRNRPWLKFERGRRWDCSAFQHLPATDFLAVQEVAARHSLAACRLDFQEFHYPIRATDN